MEQETVNFVSLLLVVGLAFVVPLLLARFRRIPVVVGEIFAGILIGRSGFSLVHGEDFTLELLAEIGFAFLMFLSGLEIDFSVLNTPRSRGGRKELNPIWIAALSFLLTVALAVLVAFRIVAIDLARDPWLMALILSTTSLGVVVPVLKERELSGDRFGQAVILASLFADFATMFLITVYVAILSTGLTLEILLVGILFVVFFMAYRLGIWQIRRPGVRRLLDQLSGATSQIQVRGALALMMVFVVLAEFVDVELILGAFLGGAVASLLSRPEDESAREKLDAMGYGFFIPVFFIMVGVEFNLPALIDDPDALLLAPLLLVAALLLKLIASLVFRASFSWRETFAAGSLLSARLSLIIAASAIGLRIGVIGEATNAAVILIAALTSTLAPLAFNWLLPASTERRTRRYVIYGAANIGLQVGQELSRHGEIVDFIEPDPRLVKLVRKEGFDVLQGEGTRECLEEIDAANVQALLALSKDDERNLSASQAAASMNVRRVVSLVNDPEWVPRFEELGVQTFTPVMYEAPLLGLMARNPDMFNLLTATPAERDVITLRLGNPNIIGKRIGEVVLPGDSLIMTVVRNGEVLIPHGSTRLERGDRLTVLGEVESLQRVRDLLP